MGRRDVAIEIAAPASRVYALYTDCARLAEWMARSVDCTGPLDRAGSRFTASYGGPFTVRAEVIAAEPGTSHQMRLSELAGLVTCVTTARFEPSRSGTRLSMRLDYRVKAGLGLLFDSMVGSEMVAGSAKELGRLKAIAERES
jgi:uncharacterized membrane protein